MSDFPARNKFTRLLKPDYIFLTISFFVIVFFYSIFYLYVSDLPLTDDIYDIFYYTITNEANHDFVGKLKLLLWQYDDHKLVFNHLVYLASFAIFQKINLVFITTIGVMGLTALLFFVFFMLDKKQKSSFTFFVLTIFTFNFSHNELTFWAMANQNAYFIPLAAALCFHLLTLKKYSYIFIASALMFLSIVSMPNGVFIFVLGMPLILITHQKNMALPFASVWLISGLIGLFTFFSGMEEFQSFSQTNPEQLLNLYRELSLIILGMFALLGGLPFITGDDILYPTILGFTYVIFFGLLFILRKKLSLQTPLPLGFFWLFCLMSLGLCAIFRIPLNGIEYSALISRYKILTCFVWAIPFCLLASSHTGNRRKFLLQLIIFLIAFTFLIVCNYKGMREIDYWKNTKERDYANWIVRGDQASMGISSWYNFSHEIFSESIRLNLYTPFTPRGIKYQPKTFEKLDNCLINSQQQHALHSGANHTEKAMGAKIAFVDKRDVIKHVAFCSRHRNYLVELDSNNWMDFSLRKKKLVIDSRWFSPGDYEILFLDDRKQLLAKGEPSLQIKSWLPEYNCDKSQMNYLPARKIMVETICKQLPAKL